MAEGRAEGQKTPPVALVDTNVIIEGAINLEHGTDSPESKIWSAFLEDKFRMVLSEPLLLEVVGVARRLMGKDFASKLRSQISSRCEVVPNAKLKVHAAKFVGSVPDEDVVHAALGVASGAEYLVSNNKEFLRSLKGKFKFRCLTPKSFVERARL